MAQPKDKAALVAALHREKIYWEALLQVVSEEDMLLPGVTGDWTFNDVVAHLTGWRKRTVARFAGALQGGEPLPPEWPAELGEDVQRVNAWIYRTNRDRPLAEVLAESRQVWQQLVEVVQALPEADLLEPGRFAWIGGKALGPANLGWSFAHLHEHGAQINDWLARLLGES
jgi:hypothetical protein